ncbi:MAG: response regulator [Desulfobacterota bacterium]|nr:response regulator [Thermodesulfobacteriota bacterium]
MEQKKILIVDDKHTIRFLIAEALKPLGHEIDIAENGEIALQKISEINYDLVIADYLIFPLTTLELVEKIKAINPDLPVLVTNTNGGEKELREKGVIACIKKPINFSQLFLLSKVILDNRI